MSRMTLGRVERVVLTEDDYVEVHDAIGNTLRMPPPAARTLHRELGKFLAASNDTKPLTQPTRGDFKALQNRVEALERVLAAGVAKAKPDPISPDCRDGKHLACTGEAWNIDLDEPAQCRCACPDKPTCTERNKEHE